MITIIIDIIVVIILIILSSFFSSSETALTTITPHRLRTLVDEGYKHAGTLEKVLSKKEKMLSVILICNNIVNIAVSALCTVLVQKLFGNWFVSLGTGILTVIILVFGEVAPKTIATYRAEKLALKFAPVIWFLMGLFTPLAAAVNFLAGGVIRLTGVSKSDKAESYTENEIRSIVEVSNEQGVIEEEEKELINNVFDFNDTIVREVMVPRVNITAVDENADYCGIRDVFTENMYTRLPVYDGEGNSFVGMLNSKDFIFMDQKDMEDFDLHKFMRPLPYTFEQKHLSELFVEMKKNRVSMMAVMDEYGDTVGIVTMEDLLEEIVGDIKDEYDADEEELIQQVGNGEYLIDGTLGLSDVNDRLETEFESEDYDSIGGLMIEKLDRIPEEGDSVDIDGTRLTAEKVNGAKIETVRLKKA